MLKDLTCTFRDIYFPPKHNKTQTLDLNLLMSYLWMAIVFTFKSISVSIVLTLAEKLYLPEGTSGNRISEIKEMDSYNLVKFTVLSTFIAPIVEEFIFRGVLMLALQKSLGKNNSISLPILNIFQAILFGVLHTHMNDKSWEYQLKPRAGSAYAGYLLGEIAQSQGLFACTVVHALSNAVKISPIVALQFRK